MYEWNTDEPGQNFIKVVLNDTNKYYVEIHKVQFQDEYKKFVKSYKKRKQNNFNYYKTTQK